MRMLVCPLKELGENDFFHGLGLLGRCGEMGLLGKK
jgi:hypothetical protein